MKNKFRFLVKESLKKKINTKWFKIINILLLVLIPCLVNIDSIIKFFGGNFDEVVNVYIVDNVNVYDDIESTINNSYLDILESYNIKLSKYENNLDELKEEIIKDEKDDIIVEVNKSEDNVFDANIISYEYIDNLLYQDILNALNTVKSNKALKKYGISNDVIDSVYKDIEVNRVYLNDNLKENEEIMKLIGALMVAIFIVPAFFLITLIIQMIGAEINEEKSSKGMEIIISSVSPKTHFASKLISCNLFALIQGTLFIIYLVIGGLIKVLLTKGSVDVAATFGSEVDINNVYYYIQMFLQSDVLIKLQQGIPLILLIIVFSFLAYSILTGVLASMTTNMEDYQQLQTPAVLLLAFAYYLAIFAAVYDGSVFIKIASFIPFISGILAPVTYILGQITYVEFLLSTVILIVTCYLLYYFGLRIYKEGILNYSSSKLWKKMFKSLKK